MLKFRFPLNLQLFADGDGATDNEEIEVDLPDVSDDDNEIDLDEIFEGGDDDGEGQVQDGDGHQGAAVDEQNEESEGDETTEDDGSNVRGGKGKNATANAVIAERKKWQERMRKLEKEAATAKRFMQQVGVGDVDELNRRMDAMEAHRLTQQGVPAEVAQQYAATQRQLADIQQQMRKSKYDAEATRLKADPFYADLDDYREEFEEEAERLNMSLEDVYWMRRGRERMKERENEVTAKVKADKAKTQAKKVVTSPTGNNAGQSTKRVQLSAIERQIAKAAGMTPEEYAKNKKR
ncbi:hypothetical protein DFQ01_14433 [Paenibacillus cellulosilyticus]|uniref:Uncharacterized protein n=1 Tax=Paenibacillus cellulosilyticus TaxID=375489 RepID=A0A2V2YDY8_9BACL|nr:hypothetical protein [Paenibacillus cellulosilyticus]PWV90257.1 hypothetical protein DFQ01_14433 [Paenibacillus cellulosilyticus]QKS43415.1 hypothetical protein HUB94_02520 [Paenibacillus cellulosilyticus]